MRPIEQHWLDRGGMHLKMFVVTGLNREQHCACDRTTCGLDAYGNAEVRHSIENVMESALQRHYGPLTEVEGEWVDYILPPCIEENGEEL